MFGLNITDGVLIAMVVIGGIVNLHTGLLSSLFSILSLVLLLFFYEKISYQVMNFISPWVDNKSMLPYISMLGMLGCSTLFFSIVGQMVGSLDRQLSDIYFTRILSVIIGSIKWFCAGVILVWMLSKSNSYFKANYASSSLILAKLNTPLERFWSRLPPMSSGGEGNTTKGRRRRIKRVLSKRPHQNKLTRSSGVKKGGI